MIDFSLSDKLTDDVIINNDLLSALQQIDLLFNTEKNEVLGDENFGTNYDKYLYTLGISNVALESKIMSDIMKLQLYDFTPSVSVTIVDGTQRDIAFIDITLSGNYDDYTKTYMIN
jgi:hypothetical protein